MFGNTSILISLHSHFSITQMNHWLWTFVLKVSPSLSRIRLPIARWVIMKLWALWANDRKYRKTCRHRTSDRQFISSLCVIFWKYHTQLVRSLGIHLHLKQIHQHKQLACYGVNCLLCLLMDQNRVSVFISERLVLQFSITQKSSLIKQW